MTAVAHTEALFLRELQQTSATTRFIMIHVSNNYMYVSTAGLQSIGLLHTRQATDRTLRTGGVVPLTRFT